MDENQKSCFTFTLHMPLDVAKDKSLLKERILNTFKKMYFSDNQKIQQELADQILPFSFQEEVTPPEVQANATQN
jgi:hypothetical protein